MSASNQRPPTSAAKPNQPLSSSRLSASRPSGNRSGRNMPEYPLLTDVIEEPGKIRNATK